MTSRTLRRRLLHGDVDGKRQEQLETSGLDGLDEPLLGNSERDDGHLEGSKIEDLWDEEQRKENLHWTLLFSQLIAQWAEWLANIVLGSGSLIGRLLALSSNIQRGQSNKLLPPILSPLQEEEEEEEEEQAKMKESAGSQKDVALEEMAAAMAREASEQARMKTLEKVEELCELSRALAVLASASSVSREREEFLQLVKKEIGLYNSMVEKEGTDGEEEAKKAYKAAREDSDLATETAADHRVSSALIERVDGMLHKLEKEIDDVDAKIGDRWRLLDRDYDGKVTPEEVASAAMYLKDTLGKEGIQELISNLSKDKEGKILVEDIVKLGSETEDIEPAEAGKS